MKPAVIIEDLNLWIKNKQILYNISFSAPIHTITVIIGPSGSGKSTLLRTINRLIELTEDVRYTGIIRVLGKNIMDWDVYELRRTAVYVAQTPNPFPHMTIYENIAIGPVLHDMVRNKADLQNSPVGSREGYAVG